MTYIIKPEVELQDIVTTLFNLYSSGNYVGAEQLLAQAYRGFSPENFLLNLLVPLQIALGDAWQDSRISVETEYTATALLTRYLDGLFAELPCNKNAPLIICACAPGELHELGLESLAYFLRKAGMHTLYLGTNLPRVDLMKTIIKLKPVAVCLSATTTIPALTLVSILNELATSSECAGMILGYGGRFFDLILDGSQRDQFHGHYLSPDALTGSQLILEQIRSRSAISKPEATGKNSPVFPLAGEQPRVKMLDQAILARQLCLTRLGNKALFSTASLNVEQLIDLIARVISGGVLEHSLARRFFDLGSTLAKEGWPLPLVLEILYAYPPAFQQVRQQYQEEHAQALAEYWQIYERITDISRWLAEAFISQKDMLIGELYQKLASEKETELQPELRPVVFNPENLDLTAFCEKIWEEYVELEYHRHRLVFLRPEQAVILAFDPKLMRQVICNLLSNAVNFSPAGSLVRLELAIEAENIKISVCDQGVGIPHFERAGIFEIFYRDSRSNQSEGRGKGLLQVKNSIERHGGTIYLESAPHKGTTFSIYLPRTKP